MSQIEIMCTIARAHVEAAKFPSVDIQPTQEGMFDITAVDPNYNRLGVSMEHLVVEVGCTVDELKARYGENAERLGDLVLDIRINEKPTGK